MPVDHDDEAPQGRHPGDSQGPSSDGPGRRERSSRPPPEPRLPFERIVPDLLKRGLEVGRGSSVPRDIASYLVGQLSDAREGVVTAVAQEVGRFLRQADIASELRNVLTGLEVEARVSLKFRRAKDEPQRDSDDPRASSPPPPSDRD